MDTASFFGMRLTLGAKRNGENGNLAAPGAHIVKRRFVQRDVSFAEFYRSIAGSAKLAIAKREGVLPNPCHTSLREFG
jgi:hypothetical protein